jgi:hypothetical protein
VEIKGGKNLKKCGKSNFFGQAKKYLTLPDLQV